MIIMCRDTYQNVISLVHGGNLENGTNFEIWPSLNCDKKRGSELQNNRISGILNNTIAHLSNPNPNAHLHSF